MNRYEIGESDLLLLVLSPDWGRFTVLAKGARRSRRRFVNTLEPFTLLRAHVRGGKAGLAPFLDQADLLEPYEALRVDPRRFVLASYFAELVEAFTHPRSGQEAFFPLKEALEEICQEGPSPVLKVAFELKLLDCSGFSPQLVRCVRCNQNRRLAGFSLEAGGVVCERCRHERDHPFSPRDAAFLSTLRKYPLSKLKRVRLPESVQGGSHLIERFLLRIVDWEIKSLRVWKEIQKRRTRGESELLGS